MSTALQIAPLVATMIALGGFIFGVWSFRRTAHAQTLMTYAARYERLLEKLPPEILFPNRDGQNLPERSMELRRACYAYVHLALEEFYLYKRGYIPGDLWQIWETSMRRTLAHPIVVREWCEMRDDFSAYTEFCAVVANAQGSPCGISIDQPSHAAASTAAGAKSGEGHNDYAYG